jgi:CO/xanthine dehydrogenase FAD-binding subunit
MRPFAYLSAPDVEAAVRAIAAEPGAKFLGGGTNLCLRVGDPTIGQHRSVNKRTALH